MPESRIEAITKLQLACHDTNLMALASVLRLLQERKEIAQRYFVTGDQSLIDLFENYNQRIKDLLAI